MLKDSRLGVRVMKPAGRWLAASECIKLETQVLVTDDDAERPDSFPCENV